ncbi:MAG: T9SS type A sorting domain-containing protein, partial [Bacteroidales bacterium]|nr:T9SS type A sorting domain-containing protein [Bacteroidales bacterium]
ITGIAVDPSNSDHMIIASGANIYQTYDGANSWENTSTGLGSVAAILSFEQNPLNPDQFTIGTDAGIFTSTDGGNSWNQLFNSLVHHVQHSTVVDGHLMAAVRTTDMSNFAIYYSTDQGDSWETISNKDLYSINAYFAFFDFQEDVAEAYINTTDLGLLKVNIDLTSVGIKDPDFSTDATIKLYPNPITDFLYVETKEKIESVSVYDLSGKLILTSDATVVDLNQVKKGFYLVQVQTKTGQSFTEKVIRK